VLEKSSKWSLTMFAKRAYHETRSLSSIRIFMLQTGHNCIMAVIMV